VAPLMHLPGRLLGGGPFTVAPWLPALAGRGNRRHAQPRAARPTRECPVKLAPPGCPVTIISVQGPVLPHDSTPHFRHGRSGRAENPGCHALYLNLSRVEYITAGGAGRLVALRNQLVATGGELGLLNVSPWVYEVLCLTRLTSLMVVRPS